MKAFGFPFDRGRLDESEHPFTEGVPGDIRVTTRLDSTDPFTGLLAALHETGHALYDLGVPQHWRTQPVGRERGMALEESQSLLFEMIVCRSRPFLTWLRPLLEKHFGVSGPEWEVENLYRRLTQVRRSMIRVDADELTYPLHVMLRYGLEKDLLEGKLAVRDLPEAWNQRHGGSPRGAPGERRRGLPAGHPLGTRFVRLFPVLCDRRRDRGAALREPARADAGAGRRRSRAGDFSGVTGWLADERARPWRATGAAGPDEAGHRQAARRRGGAALLESKYVEAPA